MNGELPTATGRPAPGAELEALRATCRTQVATIDSLSEGAVVWRPTARSVAGALAHDSIELRLPLDAEASRTARSAVAERLGRRVPTSLLADAQIIL